MGRDGFAVKQKLNLSTAIKASQDPKNPVWADLCQLVTCMYMCVSCSAHMHAIFNACTSHIHLRLCCSFISPLYPPPPLMWDTLEWEEYSPGERNRVDLHSPLLGKRLAIDPPCVSWSLLSLCLLRSITRSITSPASPTSICAPTAIHYSSIFSSVQTKVIIPGAVHIVLPAHSRPTPQLKQL